MIKTMIPNQELIPNQEVQIKPWSGGSGLNQTSIRLLLNTEGVDSYTWQGGAGDVYHLHTVTYQRTLWVAKGSLIVNIPQLKERFILQQGDRLDIPAHIAHQMIVGPGGLVCVEAHQPQP